ncbi:hypothetical protein HanRHA438_Chr01g0029161 [Helianthus annuus]|nr:hypothetical protein HanRHA438_Chr01g0029161 [Helianthus annuus]
MNFKELKTVGIGIMMYLFGKNVRFVNLLTKLKCVVVGYMGRSLSRGEPGGGCRPLELFRLAMESM